MATHNSGNTQKPKSTSAPNKRKIVPQRIHTQMMQNILIIWLDNNTDDNNIAYQNTITQLSGMINIIHKFTNIDHCIDFVTDKSSNEKAIMIISHAFYKETVPLIHNITQLHSIIIYNKEKPHEQWTTSWPKIKRISTEISLVCETIKEVAQQCEQNAISISFVTSNKRLNQLDPSFMYTQLLKEILLTIHFEQHHIQKFIEYCCRTFADNIKQIENVHEFEIEYHNKSPIWWYTWEGFLYSMLNRALRLMNVDVIISIGFFIADLHRHIEQLHKTQFASDSSKKCFTIYRGQGLSQLDFDEMMHTKGGLMSFNSFLSTTKDRDRALMLAESNASNADLVGVLFIMNIDPAESSTLFASISNVSYFEEEDEVLFSMHAIFRVDEIKSIDRHGHLYEVNLRLTSDKDEELQRLTDHMRQESCRECNGWYRLILVLMKMGKFDKEEELCIALLQQTTQQSKKASVYNQLGTIKWNQGEYREAIIFYEKALTIQQQSLPPNHPDLAVFYNNIGTLYHSMGDYPKALSSCEKALAIRQQSLPPNHHHFCSSYGNIANVYYNMGDYPKALSSHEKALAIRQQSLPPNHPSLAASYNNIGSVYGSMGDFRKAHSFIEHALQIAQQSLLSSHPHVQMFRNNLKRLTKRM